MLLNKKKNKKQNKTKPRMLPNDLRRRLPRRTRTVPIKKSHRSTLSRGGFTRPQSFTGNRGKI